MLKTSLLLQAGDLLLLQVEENMLYLPPESQVVFPASLQKRHLILFLDLQRGKVSTLGRPKAAFSGHKNQILICNLLKFDLHATLEVIRAEPLGKLSRNGKENFIP
jgi:hypothetical protein